jgi:hypothetical protein
MAKVCEDKHIPDSLKGAGPCQIAFEVKKRTGQPNWWCRMHGMDASAPDGAALDRCPGAWFEPVPAELQLEIDVADGEVAVWGVVPPAILIGSATVEPGKVHVHHRPASGAAKDIDRSYDIVRLQHGDRELLVEGMAAVAYSISELSGRPVTRLVCPRCGGRHIDELMFATYPHRKHLCNSCGRNFRDAAGPSVSNSLASAYAELGLAPAPAAVRVSRPLDLARDDYSAIMIWPSNTAIVSTMSRPEEVGIHVHAWDLAGRQVVDETYAPVTLDGEVIDEEDLRRLAVQRALAHEDTPIQSLPCSHCGASLVSPTDGWVQPVTMHTCLHCRAVTKTRRRVFLNPLADKYK